MQPELRHVLDFAVRYEDVLDELRRAELEAGAARQRHDTEGERNLRGRANRRRREMEHARNELRRAQGALDAETRARQRTPISAHQA